MKLVRKSVLLLALAGATVLASSAIDIVRASVAAASAEPRRAHSPEAGAHEGWNPGSPTAGFVPTHASWGGVFNGNWR